MDEKPVVWLGSSLSDLRAFHKEARRKAGYEVHQVQMGLEASDWKPMPSVGQGVVEIRVHTQLEHRVLYVGKFAEAIYVLHAFRKTSQRTPKADLDLARKRLSELRRLRNSRAGETDDD